MDDEKLVKLFSSDGMRFLLTQNCVTYLDRFHPEKSRRQIPDRNALLPPPPCIRLRPCCLERWSKRQERERQKRKKKRRESYGSPICR